MRSETVFVPIEQSGAVQLSHQGPPRAVPSCGAQTPDPPKAGAGRHDPTPRKGTPPTQCQRVAFGSFITFLLLMTSAYIRNHVIIY